MNNLNLENLVHIKITNKIGLEIRTKIRLSMLNARSVKNKDQIIVEKFIKNRIDIGLLTETWLKDTPRNQAWINHQLLKYNSTTDQATRKEG